MPGRAEIKRRLSVPDLLRYRGIEASNGGTIRCPLPGHDDTNASFSVFDSGKAFNCFGCGRKGDVLALHSYLSGEDGKATRRDFEECARLAGLSDAAPAPPMATATPKPKNGKPKTVHRTPEDAAKAIAWGMDKTAKEKGEPEGWHLAGSWTYHREDGTEASRVLRFENGQTDPENGKPEKTIRPLAKVAGGWRIGDPEGGFPLYRLPELAQAPAAPAFVCEGEKATDALAGLGLVATTWAHGSKATDKADFSPLTGRRVVLVPDNDEAGRDAMATVARALVALNPPATPHLLELPDLPKKGDAVEFIEDRRHDKGMGDADIRAEIEALAEALEPYAPTPAEDGDDSPPEEGNAPRVPVIRNAADWYLPENTPPKPTPIIHEFLDAGGKMLIAAQSKARKSFFTLELAIRLALGTDFLSFGIRGPRRVLVIQPEIDEWHYRERFFRCLRAIMGDPESERKGHTGDRLAFLNCRGLDTVDMLQSRKIADKAMEHRADMVVLDPVYKFLTEGTEDSKDFRKLLAAFDRLAEDTGAAVCYVHHYPKGTAGDRDAVDRGAGSGWLARDYDAAIYLDAQASEQEALVLTPICRNHPPRAPFSIGYNAAAGLFELLPDVLPNVRTSRNANAKKDRAPRIADDKALKALEGGPRPASEVTEIMKGLGTATDARATYERLLENGKLAKAPRQGKNGVVLVGTPEELAARGFVDLSATP